MPECPCAMCAAIQKLRDKGRVPLGIITYDVEQERLSLILFPDVNMEEANALLETLGITTYQGEIP